MGDKPRVTKLSSKHDRSEFISGSLVLDRYIKDYAVTNQQSRHSITYVALVDERVVGFYSLAVSSIKYKDAPKRLIKGVPSQPVRVMLLARLAVDESWQGKGLGLALVKDAMLRTLAAADIAGLRAIVVDAKNGKARSFYEHLGFEKFSRESLKLYRLLKDIRHMLK